MILMKLEDDLKPLVHLILNLQLEGFPSEQHSSASKRLQLLPQRLGDRFVHPTNSPGVLIQCPLVRRVTSAPLCLVQGGQHQSIQK